MSNAVLFAVKGAIESARRDAGNEDVLFLCEWLRCNCENLYNSLLLYSCTSDSRRYSGFVLDRHSSNDVLI